MVQNSCLLQRSQAKAMPRTVFVLLTRNFTPFVVKIISHSLSSSISSVISASLLSLLYFSIIPSSVEVINEYRVVWSPSLTEIRAVVVFVEFLMRNRELQFIHLSIGEFCWNWTFLEQVTQLWNTIMSTLWMLSQVISFVLSSSFARLICFSEISGRFSVNLL